MYIDTNIAEKTNLFGKVKVRLNGKLVSNAVAAKHGKHGFVEFVKKPIKIKNGVFVTEKSRGVVKVSFNLDCK